MMPTMNAAGIEMMAGLRRGRSRAGLKEIDPDRRAQDNEQHGQDRACDDRADGACGREAPPRNRQQQRGKIGAACNRKRQADHEGDVLALEQNPQQYRENAEDDSRDPRDAHLLVIRRVPRRTTCTKMSCESALAPASVRPATTARSWRKRQRR